MFAWESDGKKLFAKSKFPKFVNRKVKVPGGRIAHGYLGLCSLCFFVPESSWYLKWRLVPRRDEGALQKILLTELFLWATSVIF